MSAPSKLVSVPHPSAFVREEMEAREWTDADLVAAMGGDTVDIVAWQIYEIVGPQHTNCRMGDLAVKFSKAFGTSRQLFVNMEESWLAWAVAKVPR